MAFMQWDETYEVKVGIMDEQHQRLFELINQFNDAIREKKTKQGLSELLKGLADYTVYHFHSEEHMMKLKRYPNYETHKSAHESFITKVAEFQERVDQGRLLIPIEVANFLKEWLTNHILVTDKRLAAFLLGTEGN